MDLLDALGAATEEFGKRLAFVHGEAWSASTPCPEWDVKSLVAHVIGGNRFAISILGGLSASEAIKLVMSSPQLGDEQSRPGRRPRLVRLRRFTGPTP